MSGEENEEVVESGAGTEESGTEGSGAEGSGTEESGTGTETETETETTEETTVEYPHGSDNNINGSVLGYDATNKVWRPLAVDENGKLLVSGSESGGGGGHNNSDTALPQDDGGVDFSTLKQEILAGVEDIVFDYRKNPTAGLQPDFLSVTCNAYDESKYANLSVFTSEFIENVENIDLSKFQKITDIYIPCFAGGGVTDSRLPSYDLSRLDFSNVKTFVGHNVLFKASTSYNKYLYNLNISNFDLRNLLANYVKYLINGGENLSSSSSRLYVYNEIIARNIKFPNNFDASSLFAYINTPKLDIRGTNLNDAFDLSNLFRYSRIGQLLYDKDIQMNLSLTNCFYENATNISSNTINIQYIEDFFDNVAAKTVSDTVTITIPSVDISGTDILSKATAKGYTLTGYSAA